ncbi:COP9 signalosome complex subunit 7a isoform 2-T2 [Ciconia maguari]
MAAEGKVTGQSQEQFLLLAKAARGAALASLIHQVLEAPGIYVFGELLDMPAVRELADSEFSPVFRLLTIFAYGTYADYLAEAANLPPLTEAQKNKLRHLSVVTLAAKIKCIPYSVLLEQLQLKNVRQLEDLVIEAVYADVLRGSLDQRNQRLEVANLKKTIKVTTAAAAAATSQDPEQHLTELREPAPGTNQRQASKKTSKAKGLRGSAKIWSKSN